MYARSSALRSASGEIGRQRAAVEASAPEAFRTRVILVDTSVWIDHLRAGVPALIELLEGGGVLIHPFVIGELACGALTNREMILSMLQRLPASPVATDEEVLLFIERRVLMGRGIGYVDAHLVVATSLAGAARIWTRDQRLEIVAHSIGLAFEGAKR
jgi:hypothetical protein